MENELMVNFGENDYEQSLKRDVSRRKFKGRWTERLKTKRLQLHRNKRLLETRGFGVTTPRKTDFPSVNFNIQHENVTAAGAPKAATAAKSGAPSANSKRSLQSDQEQLVSTGNVSPFKRRRSSTAKGASSTTSSNSMPVIARPTPAHQREISSSLFTSNPVVTVPPVSESKPYSEPIPTNAPLTDSSTFSDLGLNSSLSSSLSKYLSITTPTQIQNLSITHFLRNPGRDTFIRSETGSGKTLSYSLPVLNALLSLPGTNCRSSGCYAIILSPTRELCRQIYTVLETLCRGTWIIPGLILGGEKKKSEKARLRKGVNILVATPGRLADHLETTKAFNVKLMRWFVLDEGDKLIEMGFEETIKKILGFLKWKVKPTELVEGLPNKRVTILCSATLRKNVEELSNLALEDPVFIKFESRTSKERVVNSLADPIKRNISTASNEREDVIIAPGQLTQIYSVIPAKLRIVALSSVLRSFQATHTPGSKLMVFFDCSNSVEFHHSLFTSLSPTAELEIHKLHGSLDQQLRTSTVSKFTKSANTAVLFSTDVAARGLDLPLVEMVVQYDPPFSLDDHVHRIGRTARAGKKGKALLMLLPSEEEYVQLIEGTAGGADLTRAEWKQVLRWGFLQDDWMDEATEWQLRAERWVLEDDQRRAIAKLAFQSHVRAYATHAAAEKEYFNLKALHLGHLAKAFALRETPGNMKTQSSNSGGIKTKREKRTLKHGNELYRKARGLESRKGAMTEFG